MACVGVLQAADDADLTETDPQELATKAWLALKAGDHEQVSEITTQCFEEFGNEAVKTAEGIRRRNLKRQRAFVSRAEQCWDMPIHSC